MLSSYKSLSIHHVNKHYSVAGGSKPAVPCGAYSIISHYKPLSDFFPSEKGVALPVGDAKVMTGDIVNPEVIVINLLTHGFPKKDFQFHNLYVTKFSGNKALQVRAEVGGPQLPVFVTLMPLKRSQVFLLIFNLLYLFYYFYLRYILIQISIFISISISSIVLYSLLIDSFSLYNYNK